MSAFLLGLPFLNGLGGSLHVRARGLHPSRSSARVPAHNQIFRILCALFSVVFLLLTQLLIGWPHRLPFLVDLSASKSLNQEHMFMFLRANRDVTSGRLKDPKSLAPSHMCLSRSHHPAH